MCCGPNLRRVSSMRRSPSSPSASDASGEPPRSSRPKPMLKLRILTAVILACLLLTGLFVLEPKWTVLAFGAVFTYGAWEWAGFGAWRAAPARLAYASAIALLLLLCWRWTGDPLHLKILLGAACAWWVIALG